LVLGIVVKKSLFINTAGALALAAPLLASADSQLVIGGTNSASAHLDFRVVIPRVLFLQVGNATTIDTVTFDYSSNSAAVGTGAVAGSITNAVVPVQVIGNNGVVELTATTAGALANADGDTISWSQISATSSNGGLPSPAIVDGGPGASLPVTTTGTRITNQSADWTFSYANTVVVPAGVYGTVNGQVTYTASMP
jgi:hypothetical protein